MQRLPASPPRRGRRSPRYESTWRRFARTPAGKPLPLWTSRRSLRPRRQLDNRADLDAPVIAFTRRRNFRGPFDRIIEILAIENVVSSELLLGLGKGSVNGERLAFLFADGGGGVGSLERLRAMKNALSPGFVHHRRVGPCDGLHGFR